MYDMIILGFDLSRWWRGVVNEFMAYYNGMDATQYGIVAAIFCIAGFLLLSPRQAR